MEYETKEDRLQEYIYYKGIVEFSDLYYYAITTLKIDGVDVRKKIVRMIKAKKIDEILIDQLGKQRKIKYYKKHIN